MNDWQVRQIVDAIREHTREYETVTVRRDGLDALLLWERASEMEARDRARERRAQALAVLRGIRKAVSR